METWWLGIGRNDPGVERLGRADGWRRVFLGVWAGLMLLAVVAAIVAAIVAAATN